MRRNFFLLLILVALGIISCKTDDSDSENVLQKFSVTFDSDGGSEVTSQIVEINKTATKPEDPKKTGYTFIDWYKDDTPFDFTKTITSGITLTAKWKPNKYTIIFDKTNGSGQDMQELTLFYDEEKSLPDNTYEAPIGMKFAGWATDSASSSVSYQDKQKIKNLTSENNSIITLYAVWIERDAHSIRYWNIDFTGETIDNSENPIKYLESQNVQLKNIERNGYNFDGWFTDRNYSDSSKVVSWNAGEQTTDLLLFAKWTPINYTITYEGIEGAENPNATTYTINDNWYLRFAKKVGYAFKGWKKGDKNITNISETGGGDITLTAQWEILQYDLYYVLEEYDIKYTQYNVEQDIILMTPNKIGYDFAGWFETSDFSGTSISGWTKGEKTGRIFVYAKWEPKTYTINFNSCGGTTVSPQVISYNSVASEPETPVYNDKNFMGWYFDSEKTNICDFSKPFVFPESFEDNENVTLYAKWGKFVHAEGAALSTWWEWNKYDEKYYLHTCNTFTIPNLYVSDHEITQLEYTKYCSYSGTTNDKKPTVAPYKPVTFVTWNDAIVYCNLRSIAEGLTPAYSLDGKTNPAEWTRIGGNAEAKYCGSSDDYSWKGIICDFTANGYRLPTEKEWEYIAREGSALSSYIYSGSNNIDDVGWYKENSSNTVHYGKCKASNTLGIYDMSGNVEEWCWERYENVIYGNNTSYSAQVMGGCYSDSKERQSNSTSFLEISPSKLAGRQSRLDSIGFRVVRTATE